MLKCLWLLVLTMSLFPRKVSETFNFCKETHSKCRQDHLGWNSWLHKRDKAGGTPEFTSLGLQKVLPVPSRSCGYSSCCCYHLPSLLWQTVSSNCEPQQTPPLKVQLLCILSLQWQRQLKQNMPWWTHHRLPRPLELIWRKFQKALEL